MAFKDSWDVISSLFMNFLTRNKDINKDFLDGFSVTTAYDIIMSKNSYRKIINVYKLDIDFELNLDSMLFEEIYENFPGVMIRFNDFCKPKKLSIKNENTKKEYNSAMVKYERYRDMYEGLSRSKKVLGDRKIENGKTIRLDQASIKKLRERAESFEYIYEYDARGQFYVYYKHIEVISKDKEELNMAMDYIENILTKEKIEYSILVGELSSYLLNFAPSGYNLNSNLQSIAMLFSDENMANQSCYGEHGTLDTLGIPIGNHITTHSPQAINPKEGTKAFVTAIVGGSGSGKSAFFKNLMSGHLADPKDYVNIMSYKKNEYAPWLEDFPEGMQIALGELYVNFLDISNIPDIFTRDEKIDFYNTAIAGTCQLFEAMTNLQEKEGNYADLEKLIREAIIKVLDRELVDKEMPHTYKNTSRLQYTDVIDVLNHMIRQNHYSAEEKKLMHHAISRCGEYLSATGSKNYMFKKQADFNTILHARLVIYDFGKDTETENFNVDDNIKFTMMNFLNSKKTAYIKKIGCYNIIGYEELQKSADGFILRVVSQDATTGRSANKKVYLIFNSPNFLKTGNRDADAILSNITNWVIGKITLNDYKILDKLVNLEPVRDELLLMQKEPEDYEKVFAIMIDTGVTIDTMWVKVDLPKDIIESDKFKTVDVEKATT